MEMDVIHMMIQWHTPIPMLKSNMIDVSLSRSWENNKINFGSQVKIRYKDHSFRFFDELMNFSFNVKSTRSRVLLIVYSYIEVKFYYNM
jgi:hypothetical protein